MTKHADSVDTVMRSKYAPLYRYLCEYSGQVWDANFVDLEKILGFPLPKSARCYQAWWGNEKVSDTQMPQKRAWLVAGWETYDANPTGGRVTFKRVHGL